VFLDRDGTIIEDRSYISAPDQVVLLPNATEAITLLRDAGFLLFLFSNQSGVGCGFFPL
jgi:D-glycero-D-manno-heptose 1,7-bisphosphate phosphatase